MGQRIDDEITENDLRRDARRWRAFKKWLGNIDKEGIE